MPNGEYAGVETVQTPLAQAEVDRIVTKSEIAELPSPHHTVLSPSQLSYRRLPSPSRLPFAVA